MPPPIKNLVTHLQEEEMYNFLNFLANTFLYFLNQQTAASVLFPSFREQSLTDKTPETRETIPPARLGRIDRGPFLDDRSGLTCGGLNRQRVHGSVHASGRDDVVNGFQEWSRRPDTHSRWPYRGSICGYRATPTDGSPIGNLCRIIMPVHRL